MSLNLGRRGYTCGGDVNIVDLYKQGYSICIYMRIQKAQLEIQGRFLRIRKKPLNEGTRNEPALTEVKPAMTFTNLRNCALSQRHSY
jgi:hypothetical protein